MSTSLPANKDIILKQVSCMNCASRCGVLLHIRKDGKIMKVEGYKEHPVSKGWMCHRGKAFTGRHYLKGAYDVRAHMFLPPH